MTHEKEGYERLNLDKMLDNRKKVNEEIKVKKAVVVAEEELKDSEVQNAEPSHEVTVVE